MKNRMNENTFLVVWFGFVMVFLIIIFGGVNFSFKGTNAYFGDGTTGSFTAYTVNYHSNYPDGTLEDDEVVSDTQGSNYNKLLDNMFLVPSGYVFVSWVDLDGVSYLPNEVKYLRANIDLYAKWELVDDNDSSNGLENDYVKNVAYGDVNLNGEIDSDDYLLIEKYILGESLLVGDALINADVNVDLKVDLVDVDIVKNAYLGTRNYVGYLPDNPILIYDIYEGSIDVGNGDSNLGTDNNDNASDNSGGSGDGNGISGSGGSTSGNGSGSNSSANSSGGTSQGSSGNSSSNNGNGNSVDDGVDSDNTDTGEIELEKVYYEFNYMNGRKKFANTKCEVINGTCEIVLPDNNPVRSGYTFKGWSKNEDCSSDNIVEIPIIVESGNIYYACYLKNVETNRSINKYYVWIIVFSISVLSLRLIWHLIYKFSNEENNNNLDS